MMKKANLMYFNALELHSDGIRKSSCDCDQWQQKNRAYAVGYGRPRRL